MYQPRHDRRPTVVAIASTQAGHDLDHRRITLSVILAIQIALTVLFLFMGIG